MTQGVKPRFLLLALVLQPREWILAKPLGMGEKEFLISTHRNKRTGRDIGRRLQVPLEVELRTYSTFQTL